MLQLLLDKLQILYLQSLEWVPSLLQLLVTFLFAIAAHSFLSWDLNLACYLSECLTWQQWALLLKNSVMTRDICLLSEMSPNLADAWLCMAQNSATLASHLQDIYSILCTSKQGGSNMKATNRHLILIFKFSDQVGCQCKLLSLLKLKSVMSGSRSEFSD